MTDEEIESLARAICMNLGLDPVQQVAHGYGDTWTPAERVEAKSDYIPDVMMYSPRWRLYRFKAAEAIAIDRAIRAQGE